MDLIDIIRHRAREEGKPIEAELNGVPIRVDPEKGAVEVRWENEDGVGRPDER